MSYGSPIVADMKRLAAFFVAALMAAPAFGDEPQVLDVTVEKAGMVWNIHVTIRHPDTGWDHYADLWQVLDAESGEVIAERPLAHPHTNEQPFTRSLSRVEIPEGVETIRIRAKCTRHGYQGRQMLVSLDSARAGQ